MEVNTLSGQNKNPDIKEQINHSNNLKKAKGDLTPKSNRPQKTKSRQSVDKTDSKKPDLLNQVSKEDLEKLCDQLSAFNRKIQNARATIQIRYDLPLDLRERLETEAGELESLWREMQACIRDIEISRSQRAAIAKEKLNVETEVAKLRADVINELEVIVSVYDTGMMERWETAKSSTSVPFVRDFLHEVKGKLEAMKNLQILGSQKLSRLNDEEKSNDENEIKMEEKRKNEDDRTIDQSRSCLSGSNMEISSQTSIPFLLDTDSEDMMDHSMMQSVLYSLVYNHQVLNLPASANSQGPLDVD